MSKTMQWAWDKAEEKLEDTVDKLRCGFITQSQAVKEIQDANEAWELMGFDTIDDVIDYMVDEAK
jgi:hypothetical protein